MRTIARRGTTLTEVLVASAILAVLIVGVMNLFAVTQKQAVSSEALLNSGTLAQLVIERLKSNITQNPRYLRDLMAGAPVWSVSGTVVDPAKASNPGGLALSPFFQYLFTREAADLYQPANQVTLGPAAGTAATATGIRAPELLALFESFRDFEVKVEIADDAAPLGTPLATGPDAEAVKRISVTVSRASFTANGGKDPLAYTVTSRLATPGDSLSDAAFDALAVRFDGPPLQAQWDEYMEITGAENPYLGVGALGDDSRKIVADAFIMLSRANNEQQLVEGTSIPGTEVLPEPAAGAKFIEPWIVELSAPGVANLSSTRRELARLRGRRAAVVFDTFKRIRRPMGHFVDAVWNRTSPPPLKDKIASVTGMVKGILAQIATLEATVGAGTAAYTAASGGAAAADPSDPTAVAAAQAAQGQAMANLNVLQGQVNSFSTGFVTAVQAERETVVLVSLLIQFFSGAAYKATAARPGDYDSRFRTTLDEMAVTLAAHMDQPDATPYERMAAAKLFCEVTAARQLERDASDSPALARLQAAAAAAAPRMAELSRYLGGGEVHDFARLKARNQRFAEHVASLKLLAPQYKAIAAYFQLGGPADQMVKAYELFGGKMKMDEKSILGALTKMIEKAKKS